MLQFFKVWCYWEHLGEHIENLGNFMRTLIKTHWELGEPHENFLRTHWEQENQYKLSNPEALSQPSPSPPLPPNLLMRVVGPGSTCFFCLLSGTRSDSLVKRELMVKTTAWWVRSQFAWGTIIGNAMNQKQKALEKWSLVTQWTKKKKLSRNDHWERNEPKKKSSWEMIIGNAMNPKNKLSRNDHWECNEPKKKALEKWSLGTQWTKNKKLSRNYHWGTQWTTKKKLSRNDHGERNEPKKKRSREMIIGNTMNQKKKL